MANFGQYDIVGLSGEVVEGDEALKHGRDICVRGDLEYGVVWPLPHVDVDGGYNLIHLAVHSVNLFLGIC